MSFLEQASEEEVVEAECALTDWSAWSSCSATCGKGVKTQSRKYINRKAMKKCQVSSIHCQSISLKSYSCFMCREVLPTLPHSKEMTNVLATIAEETFHQMKRYKIN